MMVALCETKNNHCNFAEFFLQPIFSAAFGPTFSNFCHTSNVSANYHVAIVKNMVTEQNISYKNFKAFRFDRVQNPISRLTLLVIITTQCCDDVTMTSKVLFLLCWLRRSSKIQISLCLAFRLCIPQGSAIRVLLLQSSRSSTSTDARFMLMRSCEMVFIHLFLCLPRLRLTQ